MRFFLTTICLEEDPEVGKQKAQIYAEEVRREFAGFLKKPGSKGDQYYWVPSNDSGYVR
jgi:hypothetical protein